MLVILLATVISALIIWRTSTAGASAKLKQEYDTINANTVHVKEEVHCQHLYWFNEETDEFLVQGSTIDDIIALLKLTNSRKYFILGGTHILMAPDFTVRALS
jgi:hypothetical protein